MNWVLSDNQKQMVIEQYENSLSDESKLALEEVEELYIIIRMYRS